MTRGAVVATNPTRWPSPRTRLSTTTARRLTVTELEADISSFSTVSRSLRPTVTPPSRVLTPSSAATTDTLCTAP
ncbi:hypothetical protein N8T08_011038 [Aspergillus melleus]|uniref:Uncharacterized protein n=1 Tax=Aspergillus melleus TaxID=138277 RepID=A0ACC3AQF8_9EURO|nr:hypothetical protein N8T08_011038 [Aspergillus melleus]